MTPEGYARDVSDLPIQDEGEAWDATPDIDPMQVTHRLHELRVELEEAAGVDFQDFHDLTDREQELAYAIGEALTDWFLAHPADSAEGMAIEIHNVRRYFASLFGQGFDAWDDLSDDHRDLAIGFSQAIIDWLKKEGPR